MAVSIDIKSFSELDNPTLYTILALRQAVFIVEQNCPYQDADGYDSDALHLIMRDDSTIVGYARLFPAGSESTSTAHGPDKSNHRIGRVLIAPYARGRQLGRDLMQHSIAALHKLDPTLDIVIGAQCYLLDFYQSLGFINQGEPYLEDNIEHQDMRLPAQPDHPQDATP